MDNKHTYMADVGSIMLMQENGAKIYLRNHFGDGVFKYYIFDTESELEKHVNGQYPIKSERLWLNGKWKIMDYDCSSTYAEEGTEIESDYITIYSNGTTFYFVKH